MIPNGHSSKNESDTRYHFEYDDSGCKKVRKTHAHYFSLLKSEIERIVSKEIETGFSKSKTATRSLYNGRKVWECRVNVSALPSVRVAYAVSGDTVSVVFLSTNIQKSEFTKELEKFLNP